MELLVGAVQPYAWGSRDVIATLQGREAPTPEPEAELWLGAHPSAPSGLERDGRATDLARVVAADPELVLGADCATRHEGRLPYLLKVLAAERALSIQVHPDAQQAREGFAAEEAAGVPPGAGRIYADDWPKPEALCALTPFEVLAGFRDPAEAADLLAWLEVPVLAPVVARLRGGGGDAPLDALRLVLTWPEQQRAHLVERVARACAVRADAQGAVQERAAELVGRLAQDHPGDIGVVASLLLGHRVLAPGETIFMAAGGLHAYVQGAGVEILANSDNVLRAGLTSKRIDVPELLRIVDPAVGAPTLSPRDEGEGVLAYDAPVPHFRLYRVERTGGQVTLPGSGPRIVLPVAGDATLIHAGDRLPVRQGQGAFVPADQVDVVLEGSVTAFVAGPGG